MQGGDKHFHPFFGAAFLQNLFLAVACYRSRFFRDFGRTACILRHLSDEMGSDDHSLDFIGSFINGSDFGIPVCPFHFHAFQIAASAENLEGIVCDLKGNIGSILLGHGRLHTIRLMVFLQLRGTVYQQPGAAQLGCHIGKLKGNRLLLAYGLSELDTFFGIFQCMLKCSLGDSQRLGGNADTSAVQSCHSDFKAFPFFSQKVLFGNLDIVEYQFRSRGGPDTHFIIMITKFKAFPAFFHNKCRNSSGADIRRCHSKHHVGIRLRRIRYEYFATIEKIIITFQYRSCFRASRIRSCVGFREAESADFFPFCQGNQIFLFLCFIPEGKNRPGA